MYSVVIFNFDDIEFWAEDIKDFDTFEEALFCATESNKPYEIYRDYFYVSAVKLVARSIYELWSNN